ncbi:nectin-2 isoform X2 [Triplophysa rosa]|uniref:nectin-2 isoform X2 n=1 Tax=Triplophysa rosa TaxID=992332 RepID=UPI002545F0DC|nr:nectin-2 isoform X2 [Triplophysa rosa]
MLLVKNERPISETCFSSYFGFFSSAIKQQLTDTGDSLTRIIWRKKTREDPEEKSFFVIFPDGRTDHLNGLKDRIQFIGDISEKIGSVQIQEMRLLDEGIYTCIFNLFPSGPFETNVNVTVLVPPEVSVLEVTTVVGDLDVVLASCIAFSARPAAEVIWRLGPPQTFLRTQTNHTVHPNGTFTVVANLLGAPLKSLNQQKVQCVVTHEALEKELVLDYQINIHYPPESVMIIPDSTRSAKEFRCVVDSNPSPTNYTWTRKNENTSQTIQSDGNQLPVPKLSPDFNGLYICKASNQYGSALGSLYLHVHTESSSVCWGLFGFIICCAVPCIVVCALRLWKEKHSSQSGQQKLRNFEENRRRLPILSNQVTVCLLIKGPNKDLVGGFCKSRKGLLRKRHYVMVLALWRPLLLNRR